MRYSSHFLLAASIFTLGSCGKPPPLTTAEDQRIDQAMSRVQAEQNRTDRAEIHKQAEAAESQRNDLADSTPVLETSARPIRPNIPRQHFPADTRPWPPLDKAAVDSSSAGN